MKSLYSSQALPDFPSPYKLIVLMQFAILLEILFYF